MAFSTPKQKPKWRGSTNLTVPKSKTLGVKSRFLGSANFRRALTLPITGERYDSGMSNVLMKNESTGDVRAYEAIGFQLYNPPCEKSKAGSVFQCLHHSCNTT